MFAFVLIELQAAIAAMVLDQVKEAVELLRGTGEQNRIISIFEVPQWGGTVENTNYFSVSSLIACSHIEEKVCEDRTKEIGGEWAALLKAFRLREY